MFPQQWTCPCGSQCTKKYAALMQIPWRVFCKKGCDAGGETFDECVAGCTEICYKDPVFKDQQWSSYIDRSPGADNYSKECFSACISGCGYKFGIPSKAVDEVHPKRPAKPCIEKKPSAEKIPPPPDDKLSFPSSVRDIPTAEDMAGLSA